MEAYASQTLGPFFSFALTANLALGRMAGDGALGRRIWLVVRVLDGDGLPLSDAMVELWQADAGGKYPHPEDCQDKTPDPAFCGFGRMGTDDTGTCVFETVVPGRVPAPDAGWQAPHINVHVFGRGMLCHLMTRIYFAGEPANYEDPILNLVPLNRRDTLLASPDAEDPDTWNFDIHLAGIYETVFFEA